MANKNMKRCSTLLIIRELRIKTTMSYHLTWIKMVIIKKNLQTESRRGCEEKGILFHCWWESKLIQPLWRTVWRFLKKLGIKLPYDPVNLLLGIYPEKTIIEKDTCTPMFIAALFTTARTWKQPRCPQRDEWIKNIWYISTMECYSAIKKGWTSVICREGDEPRVCHKTEVNQKEKNKYHILMHVYGICGYYLMLPQEIDFTLAERHTPIFPVKGRDINYSLKPTYNFCS